MSFECPQCGSRCWSSGNVVPPFDRMVGHCAAQTWTGHPAPMPVRGERLVNLEGVIARIRRLRNLARSSNIHEARAAAAKADELLQRYRLDEAAVTSEPVEHRQGPLFRSRSKRRKLGWRGQLAATLGQLYGCFIFSFPDVIEREGEAIHRGTEVRLVGLPDDLRIVREMFGWLSKEIETIADRQQLVRPDYEAFALGAVLGVQHAIEQRRREDAAAARSSAAIVLASRYQQAKDAAARMMNVEARGDAGPKPRNKGAFWAGYQEGRKIPIVPRIAASNDQPEPSS